MNANHAKKKLRHTLYIHPRAPTHIYICVCTYIYVCIWKQKMHTACNVGFLCVWGGWFSVKCRALYKFLGFFSNKIEMHCCLCLFEKGTRCCGSGKRTAPLSFCFLGNKKGVGGSWWEPLYFLRTARGLGEGLVCVTQNPVLPKLPAAGSVPHWDVNSFSPILVSLEADEQHKGKGTTWGTGSHRIFACTNLHLIHYYRDWSHW